MVPIANKTGLFSFLIFLLFAGSLIISLFFKENLLWMDEILSYLLISDQSLAHLNQAMVSGLDANPPLFNNLYWLLGHGISMNIVFLKAVSIGIFSLTLALFYRYTTNLIGTPIINFLLVTGLAALTYLNITLSTQIRAYALFLLIGFAYLTIAHQLTRQPANQRLLVSHLGIGLLLTLTHNFGLFYVTASGLFFGLLWLWSKDRRYWYVLITVGLIGIAWLLVWYPNFAIQAKAGMPHSWIPLPTWQTFFKIVGELAPTASNKLEEVTGRLPLMAILRFVGLLALMAYIAVPKLKNGFKAAVADPAFMLYLLSSFLYIITIFIALLVSLVHTSVFISRYLWPNHLLIIYQLIYAVNFIAGHRFLAPSAKQISETNRYNWLLPVYVLGLAGLLFYQSRKLTLAPTAVMAYVDQLDKRYPVFLESSIMFMPIWFYTRDRSIYFLLDYASAFDPRNDPGASVGFHTLSSVKEQYNVKAVMPLADFKASRVAHFYVIDERWNYQIERFIENKSVTVHRVIPTSMDGFRILECVFDGAASAESESKSKRTVSNGSF
jgi:hypothetical protein